MVFVDTDLSSGYNFLTLEAIQPYLEPTTAGPTTEWAIHTAQRLRCHVTVGYPETIPSQPGVNYNSTVTVAPDGSVLVNYRKSFLYMKDETWAQEGAGENPKKPFFHGDLGMLGKVSLGICMDINPYRFMTPYSMKEFSNAALQAGSSIVAISMAWLTLLPWEEMVARAKEPDTETITYWLERFSPYHERNSPEEVTLVLANRCGREGDAWYAGTSCVMRIRDGKVEIFDMLGRMEEKCLVIDTAAVSAMLVGFSKRKA